MSDPRHPLFWASESHTNSSLTGWTHDDARVSFIHPPKPAIAAQEPQAGARGYEPSSTPPRHDTALLVALVVCGAGALIAGLLVVVQRARARDGLAPVVALCVLIAFALIVAGKAGMK